jgi:hypothetical protein
MRFSMTPTTTWRTITEAAAVLGVCEKTIRRRIARGDFGILRNGKSKLVDIRSEASPAAAIVDQAREVADDARKAQTVALVAFDKLTTAFREAEARQEAQLTRYSDELARQSTELAQRSNELARARRTGWTGWVAAGIAAAVAGCALWTTGQLSNQLSASTVQIELAQQRERFAAAQIELAEQRERFAVSALSDIIRASSARVELLAPADGCQLPD